MGWKVLGVDDPMPGKNYFKVTVVAKRDGSCAIVKREDKGRRKVVRALLVNRFIKLELEEEVVAEAPKPAEAAEPPAPLKIIHLRQLKKLRRHELDEWAVDLTRFVLVGRIDSDGNVGGWKVLQEPQKKRPADYFQVTVVRRGKNFEVVDATRNPRTTRVLQALDASDLFTFHFRVRSVLDPVLSLREIVSIRKERLTFWSEGMEKIVLKGRLNKDGERITGWDLVRAMDEDLDSKWFQVELCRIPSPLRGEGKGEGGKYLLTDFSGFGSEEVAKALALWHFVRVREGLFDEKLVKGTFHEEEIIYSLDGVSAISKDRIKQWAVGRKHFVLAGQLYKKTKISGWKPLPGEDLKKRGDFQVSLNEKSKGFYEITGLRGGGARKVAVALLASGSVGATPAIMGVVDRPKNLEEVGGLSTERVLKWMGGREKIVLGGFLKKGERIGGWNISEKFDPKRAEWGFQITLRRKGKRIIIAGADGKQGLFATLSALVESRAISDPGNFKGRIGERFLKQAPKTDDRIRFLSEVEKITRERLARWGSSVPGKTFVLIGQLRSSGQIAAWRPVTPATGQKMTDYFRVWIAKLPEGQFEITDTKGSGSPDVALALERSGSATIKPELKARLNRLKGEVPADVMTSLSQIRKINRDILDAWADGRDVFVIRGFLSKTGDITAWKVCNPDDFLGGDTYFKITIHVLRGEYMIPDEGASGSGALAVINALRAKGLVWVEPKLVSTLESRSRKKIPPAVRSTSRGHGRAGSRPASFKPESASGHPMDWRSWAASEGREWHESSPLPRGEEQAGKLGPQGPRQTARCSLTREAQQSLLGGRVKLQPEGHPLPSRERGQEGATNLRSRLIHLAHSRGLPEVAKFLARLDDGQIVKLVKASTGWRTILERRGFQNVTGEMRQDLSATDRVLLSAAALAKAGDELLLISRRGANPDGIAGIPQSAGAPVVTASIPSPPPVSLPILR